MREKKKKTVTLFGVVTNSDFKFIQVAQSYQIRVFAVQGSWPRQQSSNVGQESFWMSHLGLKLISMNKRCYEVQHLILYSWIQKVLQRLPRYSNSRPQTLNLLKRCPPSRGTLRVVPRLDLVFFSSKALLIAVPGDGRIQGYWTDSQLECAWDVYLLMPCKESEENPMVCHRCKLDRYKWGGE